MNSNTDRDLRTLNIGDIFTLAQDLNTDTRQKIQVDLITGKQYIVTSHKISNFTKQANAVTFAHDVTNVCVGVALFDPNDDKKLPIPASAAMQAYFTSDYGGYRSVPVRIIGRRKITIQYVVLND